jgi:hypothetical protein
MKKVFSEFFKHFSIKLFLLLALALLGMAIYLGPATFLPSLWILLIPVLLAPFFEWAAHKYLLHRIVDPINDPGNYAYMLVLHYKHHWEPTNIKSIFAPISAAFSIFIVFFPVGYLLFRDIQMLLLFEFGIVGYFLFYEWIHLAHHIPSYKPITAYGKNIRNAHSWHHYKNENFWWGVTNPLGDYLLGTFKDPKEVESSPSAKSLGDLQKNR